VAENPGSKCGSRAWDQQTELQICGKSRSGSQAGRRDIYADNRLGVVTISHEFGAHPHKREIGDPSDHQEELEEPLRPPDLASLAHAELHQPRQPMFGALP
jgi:hypothetical protein